MPFRGDESSTNLWNGTLYIDGCRYIYYINYSLVTLLSRQMQSDSYKLTTNVHRYFKINILYVVNTTYNSAIINGVGYVTPVVYIKQNQACCS